MTRRQGIVTEFDFFVLVTDNVPSADRGLIRLEYCCQCWHEAFPKFLKDSTSVSRMCYVGISLWLMKKLTFVTPKETKE